MLFHRRYDIASLHATLSGNAVRFDCGNQQALAVIGRLDGQTEILKMFAIVRHFGAGFGSNPLGLLERTDFDRDGARIAITPRPSRQLSHPG